MRNKVLILIIILALPVMLLGAVLVEKGAFSTGIRLFNQGSYDDSLTQFAAAVDERPDDAARRITYGVALANAKRYDDAIVQFKKASELDPDDPTPEFLLRGSYQGIGMVTQAQQAGKIAEQKLDTGADKRGADDRLKPCSQLLDAALVEHPDNAIAHSLLADLCQVRRRYDEAALHYRRATELAPGWVKPWFNLGMANLSRNPADAAEDFRKVISIDPGNLQAQIWLGDAYAAMGDHDRALRAYNLAAASKALEPQARARIGNVYLKQQQLDKAESEFKDAVKASPQNAQANAGLGDVYRAQRKLDKSAKSYQRAADLTQQAPTQQAIVGNNLANAYIDKGDCKTAILELKKIVSNSQRPEAVTMLVDAYVRCGNLAQGIREYESALSNHPDDMIAVRFLAEAYAHNGNVKGRMTMLRKLLKLVPENAALWNRDLGRALIQSGDKAGALVVWKRGLEVNPTRDTAGIIPDARAVGLIGDLERWYDTESLVRGTAAPSLILANICASVGDYQRAAEARRKLTKLFPDNQQYWIWLGDAEKLAGSPEAAKFAYTRASTMDQDAALRALAAEKLRQLAPP